MSLSESTRRGPIACRRCRRLRSKCINEIGEGIPPCKACRVSGRADECIFVKGNSVIDRKDAPRPSKRRANDQDIEGIETQDRRVVLSETPYSDAGREVHPGVIAGGNDEKSGSSPSASPKELLECVEVYFTSYYPVGFLHKVNFIHQLKTSPESISPFLLNAILALTAGASTTLVRKHGGSESARQYFKSRAISMLGEECLRPGLECIQALYLLGLNDWGSGCGPRSWMLIGMGLRMVELLRLERRETYQHLTLDSSPAELVRAESSRRTVWSLLVADDSLAVGFGSSSTPKLDVTIPTPCDEDDWEYSTIPLTITRETAHRSLMGNTISAMSLWSRAARWAASVHRPESTSIPWDPHSEFSAVDAGCHSFISSLSGRLAFTPAILAVHRNRQTDMSLAHLHLVYQGTQILLRRMHLPLMLASLDRSQRSASMDTSPPGFWTSCAAKACHSASQAIQIALEYTAGRPKEGLTGFTPLMCFVLFLGGAMMSYLTRWPLLCPDISDADRKTTSAIDLLERLSSDMPIAARWHSALQDLQIASTQPNAPSKQSIDPPPPSSPGRIDPLGVLADLAVTQPFSTAVGDSKGAAEEVFSLDFGTDAYSTLGLSVTDFANHFGFSQVDFGGL